MSLRASRCFGRSVIALQKHATASSFRLQRREQDAQIGVGIDVLGVEANGGPIRGFGFDRSARRPQQHAKIAVRIRMIGIERNRAPVGGDRLVELALRLEDDAEIAVAIRAVGHEREALLDESDTLVAAAQLMGEHARVVQRVGIVGRDLENRAIQLLGLCKVELTLGTELARCRDPQRRPALNTPLTSFTSASARRERVEALHLERERHPRRAVARQRVGRGDVDLLAREDLGDVAQQALPVHRLDHDVDREHFVARLAPVRRRSAARARARACARRCCNAGDGSSRPCRA